MARLSPASRERREVVVAGIVIFCEVEVVGVDPVCLEQRLSLGTQTGGPLNLQLALRCPVEGLLRVACGVH
eukprot:scaffold124355_cov28-Tisochrysis_lutea.AAC.5